MAMQFLHCILTLTIYMFIYKISHFCKPRVVVKKRIVDSNQWQTIALAGHLLDQFILHQDSLEICRRPA